MAHSFIKYNRKIDRIHDHYIETTYYILHEYINNYSQQSLSDSDKVFYDEILDRFVHLAYPGGMSIGFDEVEDIESLKMMIEGCMKHVKEKPFILSKEFLNKKGNISGMGAYTRDYTEENALKYLGKFRDLLD